MRRLCVVVCLILAGPGPLSGCGDVGDGSLYNNSNAWGNGNSNSNGTQWECFSANDCGSGQYCNEFHRCVYPPQQPDAGVPADAFVPPEVEQEYGPPASGDRYVYVALPGQDTVARIDSETLDIATVSVGDQPDLLVTAPGQDVAVVLNAGSDSVSILRTTEAVDAVITLPTPPLYNRLAMGPRGLHAVAYFVMEDPSAQGIGSFQDVSIVHLAPGAERVVDVSVGFRPLGVIFSPEDDVAYVITEDGVSIVDLEGADTGFLAPTLALRRTLTEGDPAEVVITPDGLWALARWDGQALVRALDLVTGDLEDTALAAPPTDIDLTPDGLKLLAVLRSTRSLALVQVPEDIGDASAVETIDCSPLQVGSAVITSTGDQAILFTNATNEKALTLVDLATGEKRTAPLRKGVRWLALSPDGRAALVLHSKVPGDPSPWDDFDTALDKRYGFSLVDLDTLFVKLALTDADPGAFAFSPDGEMAYLIVASAATGLRQVATLDLDSFIVSYTTVGSHPLEIGAVVGTDRIYVSQDHALGRISFIDVATGQLRTVTGFQLNGQIIE
jgi:DNA-binding beta-propeller fold protein YncE